jgi:hypothetical protein
MRQFTSAVDLGCVVSQLERAQTGYQLALFSPNAIT